MNDRRILQFALLIVMNSFAAGCTPARTGNEADSARLVALAAAPGSMAPNLATGPNGTVVVSWIEPDGDRHALRHSSFADGAWTKPRTVARGSNWFVNWADFPSVAPVSETLWGAHWLVNHGNEGYDAYDIHISLSADQGDSWSEAVVPHTDNTDTEHGFVSLFDDAGGLGIIWLDGRKYINEFDETDVRASGMTLRTATLGQDMLPFKDDLIDDLTCDCCQTDIALTRDGPVAVYRNRTVDEVRDIYVSRREFGAWQPGHPVNNDNWEIDACPVNGPVIQANESTVAVAWFTAPNEAPQVNVAWSRDSGRTFADPIEVSTDHPLGHVGATLLPDGDLALAWLRSDGSGGAELLLTRISPSGNVGTPYVLEEANDIFAFSVPQLSRVGKTLIAAWTTEVGGTFDVATALVPSALLTTE